MLVPRKSIIIKLSSVVVVLLALVYLFTFHSENLDYESIKTGIGRVTSTKGNKKLFEDETDPSKHSGWDEDTKKIMQFIHDDAKLDSTLNSRTQFFAKIFNAIAQNTPEIPALDKYKNEKCGVQMVDQDSQPYFTYEELLNYLIVSETDIAELKLKHESFLSHLPRNLPNDIYTKDSSGVVYVGGNQFTWLALISIMNLRYLGSKLPVEILIPKFEEYELKICSEILPLYDAKCIYLPKLVGENIANTYNFKGYQYKSLALALSSFENVLLLDADNTPLVNPDYLFDSEPFIGSGLILWPDFWKRTTHPSYYKIINFPIDSSKRRDYGYVEYGEKFEPVTPEGTILLHQLENTLPDPSSESGQLLINKREHIQTILLAIYYNSLGPKYYYPLLSQGAAGEGDKETFIAAAHALRKEYYTVKKHVAALGRFRHGEFFGSAMGQYNPKEDWELLEKYKGQNIEVDEKPHFAFLHANFPKLDPWSMMIDDIIIEKSNAQRNRLFGENFIDEIGYDFELETWKNMEKLLCEDKLEFANFVNKDVSSETVCAEVRNHLDYLKSTTH
ncbi:hypothetical protein CANINC_000282 [Pichia inconspicua]|uniref:Alpha-1,2-mannosyltransferase n=1 Tax=Pichia inconspicua TaxID=52247 RepID=A0A4V4NG95_9ASCO|nr:hypothetical protein CANINC_000282 [[Candida] inconspicua]